ncbi:MAG: molybdopterin oxidoreductase, partial [Deltaproteobacteria bacterium]|nr:molybdopterin oxidoreductase [Deltaproteobacteria bacterium]
PLRRTRPDPLLEIHPDLAAEKGIQEGDWVKITSPRGSVVQRAKITDRVPRETVAADHGWWFPEEEDGAWDRSNIDLLTDNAYQACDPAMGATSLRVLLCDIEKAPDPAAPKQA